MIQVPLYPTRSFRLDTTTNYTERAFRSLMKHEPRPRVYGGILRTVHTDPAEVKYLLVQGRYSGKWSFPKGHSYTGEEPLTCALREIAEETGLEYLPEPIEYLRIGYGNYYVFVCPIPLLPLPRDTGEIMATAWVTLKEMAAFPLNVDVNRYLRRQTRT